MLDHPNVVCYYSTMADDDKVYLVMELVPGATLQEVLESFTEKGKTFQERRIWSIFTQLCTALRYLHKDITVVHRDLKPSNIMLDWGDRVKITDFGLAKQKLTETSLMQSSVGTLQYSCPEVIQGQKYGSKADIWGIGCILYQLAMLRPPFESSNMLALAKRIVEARYCDVVQLRYNVGECLLMSTG